MLHSIALAGHLPEWLADWPIAFCAASVSSSLRLPCFVSQAEHLRCSKNEKTVDSGSWALTPCKAFQHQKRGTRPTATMLVVEAQVKEVALLGQCDRVAGYRARIVSLRMLRTGAAPGSANLPEGLAPARSAPNPSELPPLLSCQTPVRAQTRTNKRLGQCVQRYPQMPSRGLKLASCSSRKRCEFLKNTKRPLREPFLNNLQGEGSSGV